MAKSSRVLVTIPKEWDDVVREAADKENRSVPNFIITKVIKQLESEGNFSKED